MSILERTAIAVTLRVTVEDTVEATRKHFLRCEIVGARGGKSREEVGNVEGEVAFIRGTTSFDQKRAYQSPNLLPFAAQSSGPRDQQVGRNPMTFFMGRSGKASADRIATLDNLQRRGFALPNWCVLCERMEESVDHLFLQCTFAS
ncbi:hypothetical protein LINPERHAP1_LOCUS15070 [Linum perenne]